MSVTPDDVVAVRRRHVVDVHATAISRLTAAQSQAAGVASDQPETDSIHVWAVRLPHAERLAHLRRLDKRTDDLWLGPRATLALS